MTKRDRKNPCTSKAGEEKKKWAREAAAQFVADWQTMKDGKPRGVYHCPRCNMWHTTTSIGRGRLRA